MQPINKRRITEKYSFHFIISEYLIACLSILLAIFLRLDFSLNLFVTHKNLLDSLFAGFVIVFFGFPLGVYTRKYRQGSFEEALAVNTQSFFAATGILFLRIVLDIGAYPRSVPIIAALVYTALALSLRVSRRFIFQHRKLMNSVQNNIVIYGAGSLGSHISDLVNLDKNLFLIGFLDDDVKKGNLTINGKKVLGNLNNLENLITKYNINQVIVAISSLNDIKLEKLKKISEITKVKLNSVPSAGKLLFGIENLNDLISLNESNLLGRQAISVNREEIARILSSKKILVTGAGGSIGSEIVKQCLTYSPTTVYSLDRDETALHALELETSGKGLLIGENFLLADIRDKETLMQIFGKIKPDIVFHAAALKHLPILENFPEEAFKTNIIGTENVLDAAIASGIKIFVNISTDKAADPSSVLGKSKLSAEKIISKKAKEFPSLKLLSVRFGNVIGSRGSVLHIFKYQIDNDIPLTITDANVTRYFMTVKEAVALVLQSIAIGDSGETLILDMGKPVRIEDVAKFMIRESGKNLPIVYTGLRPGEKLHESLNSDTEKLVSRDHPKIFHTRVD